MKRLAVFFGVLIVVSNVARAAMPDNFYQSDTVTALKVTFENVYRMKVVGNLFLPRSLNRSVKNPAIVVGHPMGAVKEQSANLYATKLAEQGFVTISFDLSFWGESEGSRRTWYRQTSTPKTRVGAEGAFRRRWRRSRRSLRPREPDPVAEAPVVLRRESEVS